MDARARFGGEPSELVAALKPFAERHGPNFIKYTEEANVKNAKLNKQLIVSHAALIGELRLLQENLSFTASATRAAFAILATHFSKKWGFKAQQPDEWTTALTLRLRNMLACMHKAETKQPLATWVTNLPWHHVGDDERTDEEQHESDLDDTADEGEPAEAAGHQGDGQPGRRVAARVGRNVGDAQGAAGDGGEARRQVPREDLSLSIYIHA